MLRQFYDKVILTYPKTILLLLLLVLKACLIFHILEQLELLVMVVQILIGCIIFPIKML